MEKDFLNQTVILDPIMKDRILEVLNDAEAYYRSDIYRKYHNLQQIGGKAMNIQHIREWLKKNLQKEN